MGKYIITIKQIISTKLTVEADSVENAKDIAWNKIDCEDDVLFEPQSPTYEIEITPATNAASR